MTSPIERQAALTIGTVESLSPSEITVLLETNAPQAVALNTGVPTTFPRINGYVLVPNVDGYIVGIISWLGVERASFPKRKGLKDFGLIDLPYPLRKMNISPIGTLRRESGDRDYRLERGIEVFPSVGDPVTLPTKEQLTCIVEMQGADARVQIGTAPLAGDARVIVDPDKIFGRHLAVLGNTGSGKSCSVAGLIRWSLEAARKERESGKKKVLSPNARFIILDPNGEYETAFSDWKKESRVRVFRVEPKEEGQFPLIVPAWMWNSDEWTSFTRAQPATQRPLLLEALRDLRTKTKHPDNAMQNLIQDLHRHSITFEEWKTSPPSEGGASLKYHQREILQNFHGDIEEDKKSVELPELIQEKFTAIIEAIEQVKKDRDYTGEYPKPLSGTNLRELIDAIEEFIKALPDTSTVRGETADSPIYFAVAKLADFLEQKALGQSKQHIAYLTMRIRMMLADSRLKPVIDPPAQQTLEDWLGRYIGTEDLERGQVTIIDLSLIPQYVIHLVISVIARLIFEALQRYQKANGEVLPTVLVLEEAHTFVHRGGDEEGDIPSTKQKCRETFERIAREGRKFGLGLVLSSQRPSEISPTVLAQCNTFLLHRIVNDKDQELVRKLVPDALGRLLKELPTLPTKRAILLGWATPVPVLVRIRDLPDEQQPRSKDPDFWDVWIGKNPRKIDWKKIAEEWQSS